MPEVVTSSLAPPPPNQQGAPNQPVAPWATNPGAVWSIGEQPWYAAIPEEPVRTLIQQKGYKNPAELAMAYDSLNRMASDGQNYVKKPPADATPEQRREFYAKLGALGKPDEYQLKFAEGVQADPAMVSFGQKTAHELGLTPTQAQRMADLWQEFSGGVVTQNAEQQRTANETALGELKQRWGANFDNNVAAGNRALKSLFPPAADGSIDPAFARLEAAIGSAPLVELMARLGSLSAEGKFIGGGQVKGDPSSASGMSPAAAAEAARVYMDKNTPEGKAYWTRHDPGHEAAVKRVEELHKRAAQAA